MGLDAGKPRAMMVVVKHKMTTKEVVRLSIAVKPRAYGHPEWAPEGVQLTARQRQIWEMLNGIGDYEGDGEKTVKEVADSLEITPSAVYVARQRIKEVLGLDTAERQPKRFVRIEGGVPTAIKELRGELSAIEDEESKIEARKAEIDRRKPELEGAIASLEKLLG